MSVVQKLLHRSVRELTRAAAVLALAGLAVMAYSILSPRPLPVILAMSVGHVIGAAAVFCYLLAIVLNTTAARRAAGFPPAAESAEPKASDDAKATNEPPAAA